MLEMKNKLINANTDFFRSLLATLINISIIDLQIVRLYFHLSIIIMHKLMNPQLSLQHSEEY